MGHPAERSDYSGDPDNELNAWWDAQVNAMRQAQIEEDRNHRCPSDMPPCPNCQALEEDEHEREFGAQ